MSVTRTTKEAPAAVVGVPEIIPLSPPVMVDMVSPAGSEPGIYGPAIRALSAHSR